MNSIINCFRKSSYNFKQRITKYNLALTGIFLCLIFSNSSFGQLSIDAEYRNRFEFRDGYKSLPEAGSHPAAFISQRTRLSFSYETEQLRLKFTPQDVRVWGDEQSSGSTAVYGDDASLEMFEGFAELKIKNKNWLSVGRQQLIYDNQRLFAARNWNQRGIAYDAVVYKINLTNWKIHIAGSWNSTGENLSDNFYNPARIKSLNFVWANHKLSENWNISFLHVASGVTRSETKNKLYFRQTSGFYTTYGKRGLCFSGNVYYQYGKSVVGKTVSAVLIDADVSYQNQTFTPGLGLSYLSGNKKTGDGQEMDHLFDVFYGARHRFFGGIDYFSNFSTNTKQGGLADFYIYFDLKLSGKTSLKNTGHYFQLAQTNENTPDSKNLGYENDLVFKHKFSDWCALECGYMFMLPSSNLKAMQEISESKFAQFAYLQLTVTPILFKN